LAVTTAVRSPTLGAVVNISVNWVEVAEVTTPTPELSKTLSRFGVVEKPVPLMIKVVPRTTVLGVTVGAATTVATWTGPPLLTLLEVTTAVRLPTDGLVLKVIVN
jgi:hypothetical protein